MSLSRRKAIIANESRYTHIFWKDEIEDREENGCEITKRTKRATIVETEVSCSREKGTIRVSFKTN